MIEFATAAAMQDAAGHPRPVFSSSYPEVPILLALLLTVLPLAASAYTYYAMHASH